MRALQDLYAPNNQCFGCGPKNVLGLMIKSVVENSEVIAYFTPKEHHKAFDNVLSGGICGTLLDCHSNWCAAYHIMKQRGEDAPPCTVTARYTVELLHPTPLLETLKIIARPITVSNNKAEIESYIQASDKITAKCQGLFVAVREGHPAFFRW